MVRSNNSGMAKIPVTTATSGSPPQSSICPKVNRRVPVNGSTPAVATRSPRKAAATPLIMAPLLSTATMATPNIAMTAISLRSMLKMKGLITGIAMAKATAPTTPPIAETL